MSAEVRSYDSVIAAKYLLALGYSRGKVLNVTKVQKLLFMIYSIVFANTGDTIMTEQPQAWPFGPVFPRTRNKVDFSRVISIDDYDLSEIKEDKFATELFLKVIDSYGGLSASQLTEWSHAPGSPWDKTVKQYGFKWGDRIPNEYIKEYFAQAYVS
jgi:uncharacterized phage-associated protein